MYFDLNVPWGLITEGSKSKPSKEKPMAVGVEWSERDKRDLNARLDILVHLGYTVVALNQIVRGIYNPSAHHNTVIGAPARDDILILRRLTIILTEESEKGFGLAAGNADALKEYDIIALQPTTAPTFSLACITHTLPSSLTAHIISLDLHSNPRIGFFLKHSTVRAAVRQGAVFEICYSPAVKRASGDRARRNWWANAKEVVRQTGGKGLIFSSAAHEADVRSALDVENLAVVLGCKSDQAHHAVTTTPKSLMLRAKSRLTFRSLLSEPRLVVPGLEPPTSKTMADSTNPRKRSVVDESLHQSRKRKVNNGGKNPGRPHPGTIGSS